MAAPGTGDLNKLSNTFKDQPLSGHGSRWDDLWKENITPWDRGGPSMALSDVLTDRKDLVPASQVGRERKKALVPGCGRGHDVLLLGAFGYDVYGLDYSEEATQRAVENEKAVSSEDVYMTRGGVQRGSVTWLTGDFFKDDFLTQAGVDKFSLIFDYTFFCALPPSARPAWAKRMSQLLSADGRLICLEWPSPKPRSDPGPPWGVTPELYSAHLGRPGQDVPYNVHGDVDGGKLGPSSESGLKRLAHVKPSRTHKQGQDDSGNIHDWVSVWGH